MTQIDPYNPLDLEALAYSLLRELERRPVQRMNALESFNGTGIYALYYTGDADPYAKLGKLNRDLECRIPIYVGRSRDTGARQGLNPFEPVEKPLLFGRIREHRNNLKRATNLDVDDFGVRMLVVMPIWIPLAEAIAIRKYQPLWNGHLSGFGIHAPGSGRLGQEQSQWDLIHPGRTFVQGLKKSAKSQPELLGKIRKLVEDSVARFSSVEEDIAQSMRRPPELVSPALRSRSAASLRPKRR